MTLLEQIEKQLRALPPEKQHQALDFIRFLAQQAEGERIVRKRPLKQHAAFGSWKHRHLDAVEYQQRLREEWGNS